MLIQRQFRLAYAAVLASILVALGALLFMHARLQKIEDVRSWANEVVKHVLDCNILGSESILQENARAREQYVAAAAALNRTLGSAPDYHFINESLPEIAAGKRRVDALLRDFSIRPAAASGMSREDFELQTMLATQWMLQTRALLESAMSLRERAAAHSRRIQHISLWTGSAAIFCVAIVSGLIFIKSYKNLVAPLHLLSENAQKIGAGDLSAKVEIHHRNELGMVAQSFNAMVEQLRARQAEVDEKLRDLEAFSYSVAHDLKAPLRSVVGYGGILASEYAQQLDDEGKAYIKSMQASSLRMSGLIDDLLAFGQLTHRRVEIKAVALQPLCRQLIADLTAEIAAQDATVEYLGANPILAANETLLKQALQNLISNAIKFVAKGTRPLVQIQTRPDGDYTVIEIIDNGIGIAPEHQQKIFRLFHRLHSQTEYSGTGIGLAIVQKSIERLRGTVGITSKPTGGSAFWIRLPNADASLPHNPPTPRPGV